LAIACALALGRIDRLVDGIDNLRDEYFTGASLKLIPTTGAAHAANQPAPAQLRKKLFKIRQRNSLSRRDIAQAYRALVFM